MQFELFDKDDTNTQLIGASYTSLHNDCLEIGGFGVMKDVYLRIRCMDILTTRWSPCLTNVDRMLNRQFHASAATKGSIYVFGGCIQEADKSTVSSDIIKIEKTIFGINATMYKSELSVKRYGLSANSFGCGLKRIVLYGGSTEEFGTIIKPREPSQTHDLFVFNTDGKEIGGTSTEKVYTSAIDIEGTEKPVSRAFHTSAICGQFNNLLVVCGGQQLGPSGEISKTILNDLWVLDLTEIVASTVSEDGGIVPESLAAAALASSSIGIAETKQQKTSKPQVAAVKKPCARWFRIMVDLPIPRYMHSMFIENISGNSSIVTTVNKTVYSVFVFGGFSRSGVQPLGRIYHTNISTVAAGKYSASAYEELLGTLTIATTTAAAGSPKPFHNGNNTKTTTVHESNVAISLTNTLCYGAVPVPIIHYTNSNNDFNEDNANCDDDDNNTSTVTNAVLIFGGNYSNVDDVSSLSTGITSQSQQQQRQRLSENGVTYLLQFPVDESSAPYNSASEEFIAGLHAAVAKKLKGPPPKKSKSRKSKHSQQQEQLQIQHIDYPNGDVYDGQVRMLSSSPSDVVAHSNDNNDMEYLPHGVGTMLYGNKTDSYEGQWDQGQQHGRGKLTFTTVMNNIFYNKRPTPSTTINEENISAVVYEGNFVFGQRTGNGTLTFIEKINNNSKDHAAAATLDGDIRSYTGDFVEGLYEGQGKLCYYSSTHGCDVIYDGDFYRGFQHGSGSIRQQSHATAAAVESKGTWDMGVMIGNGNAASVPIISFNAAWTKYVEYNEINSDSKDNTEAASSSISPTRTKSIFARKVGLPPSAGNLLSAASTTEQSTLLPASVASRMKLKGTYSGPLIDGLPSTVMNKNCDSSSACDREGVCIYEDGSRYTGAWRSGKRNGYGTYTYQNKHSSTGEILLEWEYVGKWVGDVRCGQGKVRIKETMGNGNNSSSSVSNIAIRGVTASSPSYVSYEGIWEGNVPHGEGCMQYKDSSMYTGDFYRGKRQGKGILTSGAGSSSGATDMDGLGLEGEDEEEDVMIGGGEVILYDGDWIDDCPVAPVVANSCGGSVASSSNSSMASYRSNESKHSLTMKR